MKTKILSILALLLMTVTQGAWAAADVTWDSSTLKTINVVGSNASQTVGDIIIAGVNDQSQFAYNGFPMAHYDWYGYISFTAPSKIEKVVVYCNGASGDDDSWITTSEGSPYIFTATIASPATTVTLNSNGFVVISKLEIYYAPDPPTAVDLGLPSGKKWADMNVGAGSATGIGTYFEWGETTAYDNNNSYSGNPTTLPLSNDAAYANWGSNWRMPTKAEYDELLNETYTTWTWNNDYNNTGVGGYLVTSKTNGNSIFLPKTGYMRDGSLTGLSRCDYWSSTIYGSSNNEAYALGVGSGDRGTWNFSRAFGFAIRPVQMFAGEGTEASPYLIASTTDWNNLSAAVNGGETYSGTYFKMTANISVSERTSTSQSNPFSGTFDGDGYTLNLSINETGTDATTAAPFGYVVGGTIKNVNVTGSVQTVKTRPASLVGFAGTNCTILNCKSSAAVSSSLNDPEDGDVDGGAFVACVDGSGTLTITGCTFTGSITYSGGEGYEGGGFVGWMRSGSSATLTDCLFAPTAVSLAKASPDFKMFAYDNAGTTLTLNNCYYNGTAACNEKITKQDGTMQMHTIAKGDYVSSLSVTKGEATVTYDVSGITVYSGGIDFYDGSTTTFYGGSGQSVSLALTAATRDGYQFKQYAASQGALSGQTTNTPTLTMPAANSTANDAVTISAEYDPTYNATFADGIDNNGWTISPMQQIEGGTVTVSYEGENKVKSVKAVKKASGPVAYQECPNDQHPHWIDLGLSSGTLWQCCNEGATVPEGYGSYYNYNDAQSYNPPTKDQIDELLANTNSGWTTLNGVYGRWFTSKNNSGKVFLPAAGNVFYGNLYDEGTYGNYWSSTPGDLDDSASVLNFDSSDVGCNNGDCSGLVTSVRPVRKN